MVLERFLLFSDRRKKKIVIYLLTIYVPQLTIMVPHLIHELE